MLFNEKNIAINTFILYATVGLNDAYMEQYMGQLNCKCTVYKSQDKHCFF